MEPHFDRTYARFSDHSNDANAAENFHNPLEQLFSSENIYE